MRNAGISVLVLGLAAGGANAQLLTFGFTDLDGSYDATAEEFVARAVDLSPLQSGGDVSLLPGGTADYDAGFMSLGSLADAVFQLDIMPIDATSAFGTGNLTITDADGDTITSPFNGTWTDRGNGFAFFDGDIFRATINDNGALDNSFDGPTGGAFSLDGLTDMFWYGAISFLMPIDNGFFTDDYEANVTLVDGIIEVPAPGSMALLALGGLAMRRRR